MVHYSIKVSSINSDNINSCFRRLNNQSTSMGVRDHLKYHKYFKFIVYTLESLYFGSLGV